ncbi:unnamed protein product [Rhizoctonia solani]|uniref:Uncharacterized protein n=1 Tax=Rhizoctonia solani TaxID=456999 RepID=A0A8H2X5C7_9AGAM|nr:unnamed protein product [Rhizoctonia solani]
MTLDFKRTQTYAGSIATQVSANFTFVVLITSCIVLELTRYGLYSYISSRGHPRAVGLGISLPLAGFCSLCLLAISLWPVYTLWSESSLKDIWKSNVKDAFIPTSMECHLSIFGCPRDIAAPLPSPGKVFAASYAVFHSLWVRIPELRHWPKIIYGALRHMGRLTKGFLTRLFFRRASPVESRMYAFARNSFAVTAIGILIFRTATALQQAQNQVGTRMISASCSGRAFPRHSIGILMEHEYSQFVNITMVAFSGYPWDQPMSDLVDSFDPKSCSRAFFAPSLELWTCQNPTQAIPRPSSSTLGFNAVVDGVHITIRNPSAEGALPPNHMPLVWLLNLAEYPNDGNLTSIDDVRTYMPAWRLRRGFHIDAEAKLITRRFIKSSMMRDVVLNAEPTYRPLSLYPIVESSFNALNNTDFNSSTSFSSATATIRTSLNPGLMYFRTQADQQPWNSTMRAEACDFIEDYRSGTVLDVVGSVGGLFALLHAAHVLLFGRPLLWGLTGAKLITPFGILGACSSREFKRRLRDRYHRHSSDNGGDTIRIGAFLRDFVIDFGPADIDAERQHVRQSTASSSPLLGNEKDGSGIRIPLMQMRSDESIAEKDDKIELGDRRNDHRVDSMA